MRINSTGLGIGTSNPTLALSVIGQVRAGYATDAGVTIGLAPGGVPNNNLSAYILWGDNSTFGGENGDLIYIPRTSTTGTHRFYTGAFGLATEKMRISSNGFVGVATASPKAVFDVASGQAHSIISTWCKLSEHNIMYNGFDIVMNEASFAGQLYVQANGGGIGIQSVFDVLANYDRICVIQRNSIRRGSEILIIPSYFSQSGSKRICIQQCNGSGADMSISAMLIGTAYGGSYICAQA
jgi:hypothetical protein